MSALPTPKASDNDVVSFAKTTFSHIKFDHMRRHDVDDNFRLFRFGNGEEDDLLHLLVDREGSYMAYVPTLSGSMKASGSGKIPY